MQNKCLLAFSNVHTQCKCIDWYHVPKYHHSVLTTILYFIGLLLKIQWAFQQRNTHDHHSPMHAYQQP